VIIKHFSIVDLIITDQLNLKSNFKSVETDKSLSAIRKVTLAHTPSAVIFSRNKNCFYFSYSRARRLRDGIKSQI
jgi:hypothetical protein